jgi:hypothetical protein
MPLFPSFRVAGICNDYSAPERAAAALHLAILTLQFNVGGVEVWCLLACYADITRVALRGIATCPSVCCRLWKSL